MHGRAAEPVRPLLRCLGHRRFRLSLLGWRYDFQWIRPGNHMYRDRIQKEDEQEGERFEQAEVAEDARPARPGPPEEFRSCGLRRKQVACSPSIRIGAMTETSRRSGNLPRL